MSKLLSIIIPTYNMEELLPRCLDSLLLPEALDRIEAMVVNDGSKDRSLDIAISYKNRFPDSVTVIDKPNGNYGSTINAALPVAKGKYVKILDSDDWFDGVQLIKYLDKLESVESDMVITHFTTIDGAGARLVTKYNVYGKEPYEYGRVYLLDDVLKDGYIRYFLMHSLTYRTEMLRTMDYRQTEGISYTDTQWSCYPIFKAKNITFLDMSLYQYNWGREGQTMDPKVIARSLDQIDRMTRDMIHFFVNYDVKSLSDVRLTWLRQYYSNRIRVLFKGYLCDIPRDQFDPIRFGEIDSFYSDICRQYGFGPIRLYPENKIIHLDILAYWHRYGKRWPKWFECFNSFVNRIMNKLFVLFFK